MRTLRPLVLAVAIALGAAAPAHAAWPVCVQRTTPVRTGLSETGRTAEGRLLTLGLRSRAMGRQKVDVLLPRSYDRSGRTRYPVLYLLHGAGGDRRDWVDDLGLRELVGRMRLIVVMPDGSERDPRRNGGYSDWFGLEAGAAGRAPAWESFHVRELVPFIDRRFPTLAGPAGHAVAGISMGGGGAVKYAAAFPGTFGYAASLSGSLDPSIDRRNPSCKAGDPDEHEVVWRDNSPTALAGNLRGVRLFVRSGDGTPGPFDPASAPSDPVEAVIWRTRLATEAGAHVMAERFAAEIRRQRVGGLDLRFYRGSHSRPYWRRELAQALRWLDAQLRRPPRRRRSFTVASARESFSAWGWTFRARRRVREFAYVRVGHGRLTVRGSGRLDVTTPGRRRFSISLGRSHTRDQTRFTPAAIRAWRRVSVRLR
ncbi:MAG: hypothetical protein JW895_05420 [Thermoleophilaceae bacterium]|nr:hypothetical protein [Thermoleophilaceae bacterium]